MRFSGTEAIKYRKSEERTLSEKVALLKADILNSPKVSLPLSHTILKRHIMPYEIKLEARMTKTNWGTLHKSMKKRRKEYYLNDDFAKKPTSRNLRIFLKKVISFTDLPNCEKPDMNEIDLKKAKEEFLSTLKVDSANGIMSELNTRHQANSKLRHSEGKKRITASWFGEVCKKRL
ncbi:hypothetical protein ILUMI_08281 [Ignelater luminosus]|uniref:Uncharacterized protein n=1 Tax=Ignelater luminosus TaxID=2038154 RepID=A0A8K0D285_IGNLU|nr:hypothetical protein ILUMI_08281 [Ignelater luminosus]